MLYAKNTQTPMARTASEFIMSEFMTIHPSHFGCIKSAVLTGLRRMYIDGSCSDLVIGIKISDVSVGPSVIDPNEGCCIIRCTFLITNIIPRAEDNLKRPTKESLHVFSFDNTENKSCGEIWDWKGSIWNLRDCVSTSTQKMSCPLIQA